MAVSGRAAPRPRRSALFLPGNNARAHEKARALPADALIFDLEDSVAPDAKPAARAQIAASLNAGGYGKRELILRVNGAETQWQDDDLRFAVSLPIDGVLLPKVTGADDVLAAEAVLAGPGLKQRMALWAMMEVPLAFMRADAIASATPRLQVLVMGTEDLGKDLRNRAHAGSLDADDGAADLRAGGARARPRSARTRCCPISRTSMLSRPPAAKAAISASPARR